MAPNFDGGALMNRRNFLNKTAQGTVGLSLFAQLFSSRANTDELFSQILGNDQTQKGSGLNFVKPATGVAPVPSWSTHPKYNGLLDFIPVWSNDQKTSRILALRGRRGLILPNHIHPQGELIYVIDGEVTITSHMGNPEFSEEFTMKMGDMVWVPPGTHHSKEEVKDSVTVLVFEPKLAVYT